MRTSPNSVLWIVFGLFLTVSSCKKDDDKPSGGGGGTAPAPVSRMTATINGVSWISDSTAYSYFLVNNGCGESEGMATGGQYEVSVIIDDQLVSGQTYLLGPVGGNVKARLEVIDTTGSVYLTDRPNGGGQLIVTSFDPATRSISLAFSGTLVDFSGNNTLVISGGNFTYRPYFGPVTGNTFSALINGVSFPVCASFGINETQESMLALIGQSAGGDYFEIYLPNTVTSGTTLPLPGVAEIYATNGTVDLDNSDITGGSIVVTSHNQSTRRIFGTFTVQATDATTGSAISVTQGAFNITYQDFLTAKPAGGHAERINIMRYPRSVTF